MTFVYNSKCARTILNKVLNNSGLNIECQVSQNYVKRREVDARIYKKER